MQVLLGILAVLGALLCALLLVPLRVRAVGSLREESASANAGVAWGALVLGVVASTEEGIWFSLYGWRLFRSRGGDPSKRAEKARKKARRKAERERKKSREGGAQGGLKALGLLLHRQAAGRAVVRILRATWLRVEVRGSLGIDDPADAALSLTLVRGLNAALPDRVVLQLEHDWIDPRLDVRAEASAWIWPIALLATALSLLLESETRQLLRALT